MANMSDYLETQLLNHILRGTTFSKPGVIVIGLCSGVPNDSHTVTNIGELSASDGYSRWNMGSPASVGDNAWTAYPSAGSGVTENASGITLVSSWSGSPTWISGIFITDNLTIGQGSILFHGALTVPKLISSSDSFVISSGNLDITFS